MEDFFLLIFLLLLLLFCLENHFYVKASNVYVAFRWTSGLSDYKVEKSEKTYKNYSFGLLRTEDNFLPFAWY